MKIVLIGSGGREHAMAWKINQSPLCEELFLIPGNPATENLGSNVSLDRMDNTIISAFCVDHHVDLVIVGPEVPLANGLVNELNNKGIRAFGPTQEAARIESSKQFSKEFMQRFNIPTAKFQVFKHPQEAKQYLQTLNSEYVIKANGLTAGKGVFLPDSNEEAAQIIDDLMINHQFGQAGAEIIIEERLIGPEISLMAFCDGNTAVAMLPAQDHKRLLDGQQGPNTGGMGAYAPVPFCSPAMIEELTDLILIPTVLGLKEMGTPFIGVLYAGLMLTENGPKVLEFNCRFGDPETQVVLPLLESDLVQITLDCVDGVLNQSSVKWKNMAAVTVVLASENYPGPVSPGTEITGVDSDDLQSIVFHAGTGRKDGHLVTAGGRVLNVTGLGQDLASAIRVAYQRVSTIYFAGMQYRTDIGRGGLDLVDAESAYQKAGVNIDAGQKAVQMIRKHVKATYNEYVLSDLGSFGGLFSLDALEGIPNPVLVASTDGVGTKVKLAAQYHQLEGIGGDIVNHCINDILVQGAKPLFFMNYYATAQLKPENLEKILKGMSKACKASDCVILGGETAEMPGVYSENEFDVAGTIVGVVSKDKILPKKNIQPGDVLIGLSSSGPHTNGYSLIRSVFSEMNLDENVDEVGGNLSKALLATHKSYFSILYPILKTCDCIKALAHLTGGGFYDNIPRILPESCGAKINRHAWSVPPLFTYIQNIGKISPDEMYRVFNMGIGMVIITSPEDVSRVQSMIPEETWIIGEVTSQSKLVEFDD